MNGKADNSELFKKVDGAKIKKYFDDLGLSRSEVCVKCGLNRNTITDAQRRNRCRIVFWNAICDTLQVPRDYFDLVEPEIVEETDKEINSECLIDLADIQLSLNKIEALLLRQLNLMELANIIGGEGNN